jgi:ribosomal protein S26
MYHMQILGHYVVVCSCLLDVVFVDSEQERHIKVFIHAESVLLIFS